MEESYLAGLLVSFLFAFVLFEKDKTITEKAVKKRIISSSYHKVSNTTATGVARYLQEKQVEPEIANNAVSGVTKYLANKDLLVSGVSKYMARQSKQREKSTRGNISGVEKYLNNRS